MKNKKLLFLAFSYAFSWGYCEDQAAQETQIQRREMNYTIEHQRYKFFIGLELRTNNAECAVAMPAHKEKFFKENIIAKIPNKINDNILALYTDYEGDYTQSYSWVLGCEVSSLDSVPTGLIGKEIPASQYAVFTTQGEFPQGLIAVWQTVWQSNLSRCYTSDFEVYSRYFDPQKNPEVKVYIAIDPLLQSVMQGRLETCRACAMCSPLPQADFKETRDYFVYAWGMDYACGNGVIEKKEGCTYSEEEIDKVVEYFSSKGLPFIWWTSAKILETKGFQFGGSLTGMALDISQNIPSQPSIPSNLKVKVVQSESELQSFTDLSAKAFGMTPKATKQLLALNTSVMDAEEQVHFIAYLNNNPVGAVSLSVSSSSAGIWSLATVTEQRKQGIGRALVHAAISEAKRRQYDQVMAILMPRGMAWGLFTTLGFKPVCEFPFYVYGLSQEELEK